MIQRDLLRLIAVVIVFLQPNFARSDELCDRFTATGNAEYPPYLWRDPHHQDQLIGASADLIKQVGAALGIKIDVIYAGPWARAQEEVKEGHIDMLAGYFLTEDREQALNFVHPAFFYTDNLIWVRKIDALPYHYWTDLVGKNGGTLVNDSYGQAFDSFATAHLSLEAVPTATQAFKKLMLRRNEYVIFERLPGKALVTDLGLGEVIVPLEPPVSSEGLYLALSSNTRCIDRAFIGRVGEAMRKVVASNLPENLLKSNLALWMVQSRNDSTQN